MRLLEDKEPSCSDVTFVLSILWPRPLHSSALLSGFMFYSLSL